MSTQLMSTLFAERLSKAIKQSGLSQAEVARQSGVAAGTLTNVIAGESKSLRKIVAISKVLKVRPEWLAEGLGPMDDTSYAPDQDGMRMMALTEMEHIIIEFLRDLPASAQTVALAQMQTVVLKQYSLAKAAPGPIDSLDDDDAPATQSNQSLAPKAQRRAVAGVLSDAAGPKKHPVR